MRILLLLALTAVPGVNAQDRETPLVASSQALPMVVEDGVLSGPGADFLEAEAARTRFFMLGEEHLNRQTPMVASGLVPVLRNHGYRHYVYEVGPITSRLISDVLTSRGMAGLEDFFARYPMAAPFVSVYPEAELLAELLDAGFSAWGIDQEFIFASRHLLDELASEVESGTRREKVEAYRDRAVELYPKAARRDGPPLLTAMTDAELEELRGIAADAGDRAGRIVEAMRDSRHVYRQFQDGRRYQSNVDRINLMKRYFHAHPIRESDRFFFKFGMLHMSRGYSRLHMLDLGNMASELADRSGMESFHLAVIAHTLPGEDGAQRLAELKPAFAPLLAVADEDSWAVVDLRPSRPAIWARPARDDLERMIWNYDAVVIAPEFTPAEYIGGHAP